MNYRKIYDDLVSKRKLVAPEGYSEIHHIVPRCMGGADNKENLISFSAREHYIAHYLLCKIYPDSHKLWFAFGCMTWRHSGAHERYIPSRVYSKLKEKYSMACSVNQTGSNNSQHGTRWVSCFETRSSKKIEKTKDLPFGYVEGRVINWEDHYTLRKCEVCGKTGCMSNLSKFCSKTCKDINKKDSFMVEIKDKFLDTYKETKSLNLSLKAFGFVNAGGYRATAIKTIEESGDEELIELLKSNRKKK